MVPEVQLRKIQRKTDDAADGCPYRCGSSDDEDIGCATAAVRVELPHFRKDVTLQRAVLFD
jgi:hypothetical protein